MKIFSYFKYSQALSCILLLLITSVFAANAEHVRAKKIYGDVQVSQLNSVYDGDTIKVDIKDYPEIVGENVSIRLYGIDTPEIRSKNPLVKELGYQARAFVEKWLDDALAQNKIIELKNLQRGKYFRIIAEVWVEEKSLAQDLLEAGFAVPYFGGTRPDWDQIIATQAEKETVILEGTITS